jgi:hypothetical protein
MIRRIAVVIALTFAPAAFAQTYIVPDGDCGEITFRATSGDDFPNLGATPGADRVTDAYLYLPKQRVAVKPDADSHSLDIKTHVGPDDGVVMAVVDFKPTISGNETRTEHAKAFVFCGANTPQADWQQSTALGLEIIPQSWNGRRPGMKPGDTMRFIALDKASKNKLIPDIPMELYGEGGGRIAAGVPAESSGMNFPYQKPGRYMVKATYRRPDPQQPGLWLVDTSTLTFEIK